MEENGKQVPHKRPGKGAGVSRIGFKLSVGARAPLTLLPFFPLKACLSLNAPSPNHGSKTWTRPLDEGSSLYRHSRRDFLLSPFEQESILWSFFSETSKADFYTLTFKQLKRQFLEFTNSRNEYYSIQPRALMSFAIK